MYTDGPCGMLSAYMHDLVTVVRRLRIRPGKGLERRHDMMNVNRVKPSLFSDALFDTLQWTMAMAMAMDEVSRCKNGGRV